jgi:hypothetical protein
MLRILDTAITLTFYTIIAVAAVLVYGAFFWIIDTINRFNHWLRGCPRFGFMVDRSLTAEERTTSRALSWRRQFSYYGWLGGGLGRSVRSSSWVA